MGWDDDDDKIKGLIFGNPKQGKTTATAMGAKLGKLVAVDTEGDGWLKAPLAKRGVPLNNITKLKATTYDEMEQNYWAIRHMFDDPDVLDPKVVVVDHMTDLERRLIRAETIRRTNKARRPLEEKVAKGGPAGAIAEVALKDINPFASEIQDYGVWTNQASHLLRLYRDLPCHVFFIAHFRTERGVRVPALTERFRQDIMGTMNMVLAMERMQIGGEDFFVAYTREQAGWYAGDRFDVLPGLISNPSVDRLVASVKGELDWATDPEQQALVKACS